MITGVSAVIPTHNRPELMKQAVESVNKQSWEGQIEIIVVFDACPVELPEVDLLPGRNLIGIANTRSRGLAGARNSGIIAASHDFVAFLDDDDTWTSEKLTKQIRRFSAVKDAVLVGSAMTVTDGTTDIDRLVERETLTHEDFLRNRHPGLHSSSLLIRRDLLLGTLGLIDEDLPRSYGEDYDLLLRASALGRVEVVNEPLVRALWNGQSYYFGQWADYARALSYLLDKHPDFAEHPRWLARIEAQIAFALASSGQRSDARVWARRALRHDLRQPKAVLAAMISRGLISTDTVTKMARRLGRGI